MIALRLAESTLRGQGFARRHAAEEAAQDFVGGYGRLFGTACATESQDRGKLASILATLAEDVWSAQQKATEEKNRLKQLELADAASKDNVFGPGILGRPSPFEFPFGHTPFQFPVAPPTISASFSVTDRVRVAGSSSGGTTSANPVRLKSFVTSSNTQNIGLSDALTPVRQAWSQFRSQCSWVRFGSVNFLAGFNRYLEENRADAVWIGHVAAAFAEAGGGPLTSFELNFVSADIPGMLATLADGGVLTQAQVKMAAQFLVDNPELDHTSFTTLLAVKGVADGVGQMVAEQARALNEDSSTQEMADLAALFNQFSASGPGSAAILSHIGAGGVIQTLSLTGLLSYTDRESSADLAASVRAVFRTGEPAMAISDPNRSRAFAHDLVAYLASDRPESSNLGNDPQALSYLLRDSVLSTPFLGTLGNELEAFEQSFAEHRGTWGQKSIGALGGGVFIDEANYEAAFDPVASYMTALGKNGEASLQFFTGTGAESSADHLSNSDAQGRRQYWIERRKWGHDNFDGLLGALDSATTDSQNLSTPDTAKSAATLASGLTAMLGNRIRGLDSEGNKIKFGSDDERFLPGTVSAGGSVHLAHIFSTYMPAVDYFHGSERMEPSSPAGELWTINRADLGNMSDLPVFNMDDLDLLIQTGVSTEEGFVAFRQGLSNYQDARLSGVFQTHFGTDTFDETFERTMEGEAKLEGLFMRNIGEQKIADGLDKDEQVEAWVNLGSDLAGEIPFDKIPVAGPVVGFLADQAIDTGTDALTESLAIHEQSAISNANRAAQEVVSGRINSIVGIMYGEGIVTLDDVRTAAENHDLDPNGVAKFFNDGFPDAKTIESSNELGRLIYYLGDSNIDINSYSKDYEHVFMDYFK